MGPLRFHLRGPGAAIAAAAHARYACRRLRGERREVLIGPEQPLLPEVMWKVLRVLGVRAAGEQGPRTVACVHWSLATVTPPSTVPGAINGRCVDISKRRVDAAMRAVFGYDSAVDPRRHHGPLVAKSEENARHDGRVLYGPLAAPAPHTFHQRLIDTETRGLLHELRIPIVAGAVPFLYVKRRPIADRFGHAASATTMATPQDHLSPTELARVVALSAQLRLDVGEVDALRDAHDGRLYVVDVNRTPWGPPRALGARGAERALRRLADAYAELLLPA